MQHAAQRVLAGGWVAQGREVAAFENELCAYLGLPDGHAVAVSSGSAALFLALSIFNARGSTVACPVYSCGALTDAITLAGARPHLVDTAKDSPNVDPGKLQRSAAAIAIMPHIFGTPVDVSAAAANATASSSSKIALRRSAPSLTAFRLASPAASEYFRFYATKMITSGGQGGMLASRDRALADAARDYREFDCRRDRKPRFNFQMTDLAAVGRLQLRKLPSFVERRECIFARYRDCGLEVVEEGGRTGPVRYRTVIRTEASAASDRRTGSKWHRRNRSGGRLGIARSCGSIPPCGRADADDRVLADISIIERRRIAAGDWRIGKQ
ncbi:MAG: DegT/DnrJ/EryC1/StrS family aminotransferase [Rhizomicrobium sp.]